MLHKEYLTALNSVVYKSNTAQRAHHGFARHLPADFPTYRPEISCQTQSMPAEFLNDLTKNLTAHLTHDLCAVLPKE